MGTMVVSGENLSKFRICSFSSGTDFWLDEWLGDLLPLEGDDPSAKTNAKTTEATNLKLKVAKMENTSAIPASGRSSWSCR
jgi:hypothetical protein